MALAPDEKTYQRTVAPGGAARLALDATPAAFGAGIGAQVEDIGQQMHRAELKARELELQREEEMQQTQAAKDLSELGAGIDAYAKDSESQVPEDGAGYRDRVVGEFKTRLEPLVQKYTNPRVRDYLERQAADMQGRTQIVGDRFEAASRVAQRTRGVQQGLGASVNRIANGGGDIGILTEEELNSDPVYDKLPISPADREKLRFADHGAREAEHVRQVIYKDPEGAMVQLYSGKLAHLTPEQQNQLRGEAETEIRRRDAKNNQDNENARTEANIKVSGYIKDVSAGRLMTDGPASEILPLFDIPELKLAGRKDEFIEATVKNKINNQFANVGPEVIANALEQARVEIANQVRQGKDPDRTLVWGANHLEAMLGQRRVEARDNPHGAAARTGFKFSPVDFDDEASKDRSYNEIAVWHRQHGGVGPPPVLNQDQLGQFQKLLGTGTVANRAAVIQMLASRHSPYGQAAIAQLAPKDHALRVEMALAEQGATNTMQESLDGANHYKTNPAMIRRPNATDEFGKFATAMTGFSGELKDGLFQTALNIYATRQGKTGNTSEWPELNDSEQRRLFREAVYSALGSNRGGDGVAHGGIGQWAGQPFVLPTTMGQSEVSKRIAAAGMDDFVRASIDGVAPMTGRGKPPTIEEMKGARLEQIRDGVYKLKYDDKAIQRADRKGDFMFDISKLPRR